jgi:hypothetical protein
MRNVKPVGWKKASVASINGTANEVTALDAANPFSSDLGRDRRGASEFQR